ncbi:MAG: hypothetical protein IPK32_22140 [Verrucomicrobiaceae bacterium]|nr:hypothetical protein [Verrucomicrobiaceae bacterium]
MTSRHLLHFFALLTFLTTASTAQESTFELRPKWQPDQFYLLETDTDTLTSLTALGQKHDQKLHMRQTTSVKVRQTTSGELEARVTLDSLKGEMIHDGILLPFDADAIQDAHPILQKTIGRATGKAFTLAYDAQGRFLDARDMGTLIKGGQTPDLNSIADAKQVALLFRRSLEMALPNIPVRPDDKWISDESISFPEAGRVQVRLNAKFTELTQREGHRTAKITFEGALETQTDQNTRHTVKVGKDSKVSGEVHFDLDRQTVSHSTILSVLQLEVEGKKLPVRQQVTTRLVAMKRLTTGG